jgi:hypothetical protein
MCGPADEILELPENVKLKEGSIVSKIFQVMRDQTSRTLAEIASETELNIPVDSISARLRDLRKKEYGGFTVEKWSYNGDGKAPFEYALSQ